MPSYTGSGGKYEEDMDEALRRLDASKSSHSDKTSGKPHSQWGSRPMQGPRQQKRPAGQAQTGNGQQHKVAPGERDVMYGSTTSTPGQRPGSPKNGMMGSPNLGQVSSLQSYAATLDKIYGQGAGQQYLNRRGINPTVNGMNLDQTARLAGMPSSFGAHLMGPNAPQGEARQQLINDFTVQNTDGQGNAMLQAVPGPNGTMQYMDSTGMGYSGTSGGQTYNNGRLVGPAGGSGGGSGSGSGLSGQIESTYSDLMSNPTGYSDQQEQMLRNRATEGIALAGNQAADATRMDAIRRGAATDDADIRDQLNRVTADSAKKQSDASFDVDMGLAGLSRQTKLSAAGGAANYDAQIRQLLAQLAQQEEENGPLQGLESVMGG